MTSNLTARPAAIIGKGVGMVALQRMFPGDVVWWIYNDDYPSLGPDCSGCVYNDAQRTAIGDYFCKSGEDVVVSSAETPLVFDATTLSNHEDVPNMLAMPVARGGRIRIAMVAIKEIRIGEELTHNFNLTCPRGHTFTGIPPNLAPTRALSSRKVVFENGSYMKLNYKHSHLVALATDDIVPEFNETQAVQPFSFHLLPPRQRLWVAHGNQWFQAQLM